jgi:hypothetical protein
MALPGSASLLFPRLTLPAKDQLREKVVSNATPELFSIELSGRCAVSGAVPTDPVAQIPDPLLPVMRLTITEAERDARFAAVASLDGRGKSPGTGSGRPGAQRSVSARVERHVKMQIC